MRSVARIKLGWYPLPPSEGSRLRQLLHFPDEAASVLDPCAGTGAALLQITKGANVERYAVELDALRAQTTREAGINTIQGNLFEVQGRSGSISLLYLNPPYDLEVASFGNKRMELLFLQKTFRWLTVGGVLVMVVPHGQLHGCTDLLSNAFTDFQVLRLTDPESERFDQVVLLAVRARVRDTDYERNREQLVAAICAKVMPTLTGQESTSAEIGSRALSVMVCSGTNLLKPQPVLWAQWTSWFNACNASSGLPSTR